MDSLYAEAINKHAQLANFYSTPALVSTLLRINDPRSSITLPFPSIISVKRVKTNREREFSFLGRNQTNDLIERILSVQRTERLVIKGNMGSGKSYMIASAVMKLSDPNDEHHRKVVYISDCEGLSHDFEANLLSAIYLAFSSDPEFINEYDSGIFDATSQEQRQYMKTFIDRRSDPANPPIIFVLDGYNYFQASSNYRIEDTRAFLSLLCCRCATIMAITAQNPLCVDHSRPEEEYYVHGGLSEDEWNGWKSFSPFDRLAYSDNNHDQDVLQHITGYLPIILRKLAVIYKIINHNLIKPFVVEEFDSLDQRLDRYYMDLDSDDCGGLWMKLQLEKFSSAIFFRRNTEEILKHVDMMRNALVGRQIESYDPSLMDHRFFTYLPNKRIIVPCCGYVKEIIANDLMKSILSSFPKLQLSENRYFGGFHIGWLIEGIQLAGKNEVMKQFVFRHYVIANQLVNLARMEEDTTTGNSGWSKLDIRHFYLHDYNPRRTCKVDAKDKPYNTVVFIPEKLLYHQQREDYLDMIVRKVITTSPATRGGNSRRTIRKMSSRSTAAAAGNDNDNDDDDDGNDHHHSKVQCIQQPPISTTVEMTYIQITLRSPEDQMDALRVFTDKLPKTLIDCERKNQADYLRYVFPTDDYNQIVFKFKWIVPQEVTNSSEEQQLLAPHHLVPPNVATILQDLPKNHTIQFYKTTDDFDDL